jgi:hypothetical protein
MRFGGGRLAVFPASVSGGFCWFAQHKDTKTLRQFGIMPNGDSCGVGIRSAPCGGGRSLGRLRGRDAKDFVSLCLRVEAEPGSGSDGQWCGFAGKVWSRTFGEMGVSAVGGWA